MQKTERTGRKPVIKPNALIIRPTDKSKYVEIIGRIKKEKATRHDSSCVDNIRKSATGDMLIVLAKGKEVESHELEKSHTD